MIKRKISIAIIIGLVITLIIVSFKYKSLLEEYNWQLTNADLGVKGNLSIASASFGGNSLSVENSKSYNYNQAMSQIASATQLFQFTTYNKNNNGLLLTLDNLCNLMKQDEYKEAIVQKSELIYDALFKLSLNPEDKQATENLSKLIDEIRQKK
ncbi:MAG: hypothetical protein P4L41_18995 [Flavipsychrobacter sp.]|nr:hypothetical protein [Flavipsychrobacter sp.]